MPSAISFTRKKNFLVMTITGEYNYWEFIKYPKILRHHCIQEKYFKVLVDVRGIVIGDMPVVEQFFLGEHLAEVLRDHIKLAIVLKQELQGSFFQNVTTNRDALVRLFNSAEKAATWLLRDKENEPLDLKKNTS